MNGLVERGKETPDLHEEEFLYAVISGDLEKVKFLIKNGADIHVRDDIAPFLAIINVRLDVLTFLVQNRSTKLDERAKRFALLFSAQYGMLDFVKFLLKNIEDIWIYAGEAKTLAEMNGHAEVLKYLRSLDL